MKSGASSRSLLLLVFYSTIIASLSNDTTTRSTTHSNDDEQKLDELMKQNSRTLQHKSSSCEGYVRKANQLFTMKVNITSSEPYQCTQKEESVFVKIIEDETARAVRFLSKQFSKLITTRASSCTRSSSSSSVNISTVATSIDQIGMTNRNNTGASGSNSTFHRRLFRFGNFMYMGGIRCR